MYTPVGIYDSEGLGLASVPTAAINYHACIAEEFRGGVEKGGVRTKDTPSAIPRYQQENSERNSTTAVMAGD